MPTITAVYPVAGGFVAAVDGADVPWIARKSKSVLCNMDNVAVAEAMRSPYRIAADGQRVEWDSGYGVGVADLLDEQKAAIFFTAWRAADARPGVGRDELVGCWQTAAGYTLLEASGTARIKLVGRGPASDMSGEWRWRFVGPQEFQTFREDAGNSHTHRVSAHDGRVLILSTGTRVTVGGKELVIEMGSVWKRSKPPKSWGVEK